MLLHELLYFLNAAGSRISNMTFSPPCVMKVISMHFSEFALHFTFYNFGLFDGAYRRPMDAIFVIISDLVQSEKFVQLAIYSKQEISMCI